MVKHLVIFLFVVALFAPGSAISTQNKTAGLGVCHFAPASMPDGFDWAYETSLGHGVFWREIEPMRSVYTYAQLDSFLDAYPHAWLSFQTGSMDAFREPKAPMWAIHRTVYHYGTCSINNGIFAPWDTEYQSLLNDLMRNIGAHLAGREIAGVVMQSGGMYGETQLWSCSMANTLRSHYGYSDQELQEAFIRGGKRIIDIYAIAFPDTNLMLQVGWPAVDDRLVRYAATVIGPDRLYVKWSGLDPTSVGKQEYLPLFAAWSKLGIHLGLEVGHPTWWQSPVGSGQWDASKITAELQWAVDVGASFLCVQQEMVRPVTTMVDYVAFDSLLEANSPQPPPTPVPTSGPMKCECECVCTCE